MTISLSLLMNILHRSIMQEPNLPYISSCVLMTVTMDSTWDLKRKQIRLANRIIIILCLECG